MSTPDLLLESLKARRKHHRTQQVIDRVSNIVGNIDNISLHDDRSSLGRLFEYFMEGITTWFPDEPAKRLIWLLGAELEVEELPSVKAKHWLDIYRTNDALPENRNPDVAGIAQHFRGPVGLEGCWLGDIDNFKDAGVFAVRLLLHNIEDFVEGSIDDQSGRFLTINEILDIADALVTGEDDDQ
jgi:hypothetical protein